MSQINLKQAAVFLLAGAAVGTAVALLCGPQGGRNAKNFKKFARKTVNRLDDLQGDIRIQVTDWVDNMTEIVSCGMDSGKKLSAEGYDQVLQGFDSAKKSIEAGRIRIEQLIKTA